MRNAKEEFIKITNNKDILCAEIEEGYNYFEDPDDSVKRYLLKKGYSDEDYNNFLESLDFEYDNGFGGQILYGTIWLKDNTWIERAEYDGSEWWVHKYLPEVPKELLNNICLN